MVNEINDSTVSVLMRCSIPELENEEVQQAQAQPQRPEPKPQYVETKENPDEPSDMEAARRDTRAQQPTQPIVNQGPKIGRNDPCPCGSGKKYKHCHGKGL